jgi:hypothetical protein
MNFNQRQFLAAMEAKRNEAKIIKEKWVDS